MTARILPFFHYVPAPELRFYRGYTRCLLRRYFHLSMAIGRLPSIMGREIFRARITHRTRAVAFENAVIFVTDVERCLERLDPFPQQLISRCVLQEYNFDEAAPLCGCSVNSVRRRLPDALDQLSEVFLEVGILKKEPEAVFIMEENMQETMHERGQELATEGENPIPVKSCQVDERDDLPLSA